MRKDLESYFYCTGCIWDDACENEIVFIDGTPYHIAPGSSCGHFSPAGELDEIDYYQRDLTERANIYHSLVEEYQ